MTLRDFALLVLVCLAWAANNILLKYVVSYLNVPPLFFAAVRFALIALVLLPWLRPTPRPLWRLIAVSLLMGGGTFGLMFVGLKTATPSAAAVVMQIGVPITAFLSMLMLGERFGLRRMFGMVLTLAGALTVVWNPHGLAMSTGLLFVAASTLAGSVGSILMKQMQGMRPLQYQAWVGLISVWPLALLSAVLEPGQVQAGLDAGWRFAVVVVVSGVVVSALSQSMYFLLVQRYEASLISVLILMTPLATIALSVAIFGDPFGPKMMLGTLAALVGVVIVATRPNQLALLVMALRSGRK